MIIIVAVVIINLLSVSEKKDRISMKKGLFILLAALSAPSAADVITYQYEVTIDSAFGSLGAGATLSGEFSFNSDQSGTDLPSITNAKKFVLSGLSLSDGSGSIEPDKSDSWLVVGDDSPPIPAEDFFTVRAEGFPLTGTLGGLSVDAFYLLWTDTDGSANNGFSLPLNEGIFSEYESAIFQLQGPGLSSTNGIISNVSLVPVPAAVWLFGSGLLGLVGIARKKAV
jgi:hypothetical protein